MSKKATPKRELWRKFGFADVVIYLILGIIVFIMVFPFWNAIVLSFNEGRDAQLGGIYFWPRKFTLDNYAKVITDSTIWNAFFISVLRAVLGVGTTILVTGLFSYAISKPYLKFRKFYLILVMVSMYFAGGLIPTYLTVKGLGLLNNFLVYIVMWMFNAFYALVFLSFFKGIPAALVESAKIDGAGEWRIFFRMILPLSKPVVAAVSLFVAVNHWNAWYDNMLYVKNPQLNTLSFLFVKMIQAQQAMENFASTAGINDISVTASSVSSTTLSLATMMVAVVPVMCVYPFVQKYFTSGIMIGSVKG